MKTKLLPIPDDVKRKFRKLLRVAIKKNTLPEFKRSIERCYADMK